MFLSLCLEIYSQSSIPRQPKNSFVRISSEALDELNFWKSNLAILNGIPIWPVRHKPSKIVYSDASGSACGSFIEFEEKVFHQNGSHFENAQSSTFRELLGVSLSMQAFVESLKAQTVTWFTDNQNVVLRRIRFLVSQSTAVQIYNALIQLHFDYCAPALDGLSSYLREKLQKLQIEQLGLFYKPTAR